MTAYTIIFALFLLHMYALSHARFLKEHFLDDRNYTIELEKYRSLGGYLVLSENETAANKIIMNWKTKEMDEMLTNYRTLWDNAEKSQVYKAIRKMPKGAALHIHSSYMLDANSMIALTHEYGANLYACYHTDLKLHFSESVPPGPCPVKWELLSKLRSEAGNAKAFDEKLKKHFCFLDVIQQDPYKSINEAWERFEKIHKTIKSLLTFRPVREKYFYRSLEKFYDDNVKYVEIRSGLNSLYELDGSVHERMYMARLYKNITEQFIETHPDFMGFKFILTGYRNSSNKEVSQTLDLARELKREMPEYFAGFDLVGQEDLGRPLIDFLPEFSAAADEIDFYFHAGETNLFGTSSDDNLIDAMLLGTKRIGHGYALTKHPRLLEILAQRDIPIEVNVISNALLSLVSDVSNHPLSTYLALDIPVVLSSDDPSAFRVDPLSHDFYIAFVYVASKRYDLRMLKKLALNSIRYSALDDGGKDNMYRIFQHDWDKFIEDLISTSDLDPVK